jgi:hypothetical protein
MLHNVAANSCIYTKIRCYIQQNNFYNSFFLSQLAKNVRLVRNSANTAHFNLALYVLVGGI